MTAASPPLAESAPQNRSLLDGPVLPWALAAYGLVSLCAVGDLATPFHALSFSDSDDAMRFVEVRDLVAGQGWFDMIQHRFLPPAGVLSHWSRLLDAPLAASIAALTPLLGASLAERLTVALWPVLLLLVYLLSVFRGMRGLFGQRAALFGVFAATQTIALTMQFKPTRIDHHNVQIVLLTGVGLCLMQAQRTSHIGAIAGALAAGSLAIGLEALPLVGIAGVIVAADWWRDGRPATSAFLGFGLAFALAATALFGIQTAPALWSTSYCDALSPPWIWFTWVGAATAAAAAWLQPERMASRIALTAGIGIAGMAGFALLFPVCLHGPFTGMPELVRTRWLEDVREMLPIATLLAKAPAEGLAVTAVLFVAAIAAAFLAAGDRAHRRSFTVLGLFLGGGAVQTCFQMRGLYVPSAFVPLVAGVCLDRALPVSATPPAGRLAKVGLVLAALALNAHVWAVLGRTGEGMLGRNSAKQDRLDQAASCLDPRSIDPLATLKPGLVLAAIDLGPFLLAHTAHSIVAAPYHRAIAGLSAGLAVTEGSEEDIRRAGEATRAAYLVLCPDATETGFGARLVRGEASAGWLEPLALQGTPLKAWRIR